jgi:hypothetical protein
MNRATTKAESASSINHQLEEELKAMREKLMDA